MNRSITLALVALLSVAFFSAPAEARKRHKHKRAHHVQRVVQAEPCFFICEQAPAATEYRVTRRGKRVAVRSNRQMVGTAGIVAPLAAKVAQIQAACGSTVVSGVRHTRIAGTRRWSLHTQGKAVDMVGNPSCIYSQLHGWAGGYSTDYGRVRHVHISYDADGGREMGVRFAHGGHRKHGRRYARRGQRHHHYVAAR